MNNQTMFRVVKDKGNPYVMLNKQFLNDEDISWKAKGILAYLLSLPDDWQIYESEVVKHSKDGLNALRSGLKELIDNGYVVRLQKRNGKGHFVGYEYCVYEIPTEMRKSDNGQSDNGKSHTTNNDITNNDLSNNKKYIHLPLEDDSFINYYGQTFKAYKNKEHPRITVDSYNNLVQAIEELQDMDIDLSIWVEQVEEHFRTLPISNNGNILAFIKASKRYFDVDIEVENY